MLQRIAYRGGVLVLSALVFSPGSSVEAQTIMRGPKPVNTAGTPNSRKPAVKKNVQRVTRTPKSRAAAKSRGATPSGGTNGSTMTFAEAVAFQASLDRAGFSPGIIDGLVGRKTIAGLKSYQSANGLAASGMLDNGTRLALGLDSTPATTPYRLTAEDQALVGPCPKDWKEKAASKMLGLPTLANVAAFRGHCTMKLLERLNVGRKLPDLKVGDVVVIPNVSYDKTKFAASRVEIDFSTKLVRAYSAEGKLIGLFHCSIAKQSAHRPEGPAKVITVTMNPNYTFKPESWPEVKGIDKPLEIPPGPKNPVGMCWIGLDQKGYGIHGTPEPELIGKTGSHGCIRLANWDVLRLADMVKVGTDVKFVDSGETLAKLN